MTGWWGCGKGHVFTFGQEAWHHETNQGLEDGKPIPMYCTEDLPNGEPCMNSAHLIGPYDTAEEVQAQLDRWLPKWQ